MDKQSLIRQARGGDDAALSELCRMYHPILTRYFVSLLRTRQGAEDLAQETLIKMLRSLPNYKSITGKYFEGWLFRIAHNCFIDLKRKKADAELPETYDPPDPGGGAEDRLIASEKALAVRQAVNELDEESRAMVTMRYELELDYKSIALALNTTPNRVKWRLNDAKAKLKRTLEKEGFEWTN